jgi:hypothetical protein
MASSAIGLRQEFRNLHLETAVSESRLTVSDAATSPSTPTAKPKSKTQRIRNTLGVLVLILWMFWIVRPDYRPFIPWLNPTVKPALRPTGDKQALVVGGFNNGAAVYGVKVTLSRPGQSVQLFTLERVEPGYLYAITSPPDPIGQLQPVFVQPGDTVTIEANTYWMPLVYRFDQLEPEVHGAKPVRQ